MGPLTNPMHKPIKQSTIMALMKKTEMDELKEKKKDRHDEEICDNTDEPGPEHRNTTSESKRKTRAQLTHRSHRQQNSIQPIHSHKEKRSK